METADGLHAVTLCGACEHVHDRKLAPYAWLCMAHPRLPAYDGFLTDRMHERQEPYLRCATVNGGLCRLYQPKRDGQLSMIEERK